MKRIGLQLDQGGKVCGGVWAHSPNLLLRGACKYEGGQTHAFVRSSAHDNMCMYMWLYLYASMHMWHGCAHAKTYSCRLDDKQKAPMG